MKRELQRKMSFVLFVMAVFYAGMALTVFQEYIWMACIAGILLLATSVFYVLSQKEESQSPTEKTTDLLFVDRMAELMRGNEKAEKGVYIAVKKQHEAMENGMAALEKKIAELIKAQENAVKTLVMYNKENAKQMALSEREELGRLREELRHLQQGGESESSMSSVVEAIREMSRRLYEELHENGEAMLSELETTVDCLGEMKEIVKGLEERGALQVMGSSVINEPVYMQQELEVIPEPENVEEPVGIPEVVQEPAEEPEADEEPAEIQEVVPEPAEEPEAVPEPVVDAPVEETADTFASSGVDLSDPNKTMSADDIAALFAQMSASAEEPESAAAPELTEEPVVIPELVEAPIDESGEEGKPEDAFASSGVDLTDPNKSLSADDIAALFASMGN